MSSSEYSETVDPTRRETYVRTAATTVIVAAILAGFAIPVVRMLIPGPIVPLELVGELEIVHEDGEIPMLEGVDGPAVEVDPSLCSELADAGALCLTVPLRFRITNTTDRPVVAATFGGWQTGINGDARFCVTATGDNLFTFPPGDSVFTIKANVPLCVAEDLAELAAEGVDLSRWIITGSFEPIGGGEAVALSSPNFVLRYTG